MKIENSTKWQELEFWDKHIKQKYNRIKEQGLNYLHDQHREPSYVHNNEDRRRISEIDWSKRPIREREYDPEPKFENIPPRVIRKIPKSYVGAMEMPHWWKKPEPNVDMYPRQNNPPPRPPIDLAEDEEEKQPPMLKKAGKQSLFSIFSKEECW